MLSRSINLIFSPDRNQTSRNTSELTICFYRSWEFGFGNSKLLSTGLAQFVLCTLVMVAINDWPLLTMLVAK